MVRWFFELCHRHTVIMAERISPLAFDTEILKPPWWVSVDDTVFMGRYCTHVVYIHNILNGHNAFVWNKYGTFSLVAELCLPLIQSRPKQERRWLHLRRHHLFFSRGNGKAVPANSAQIRTAVRQANGKAW